MSVVNYYFAKKIYDQQVVAVAVREQHNSKIKKKTHVNDKSANKNAYYTFNYFRP